MRNHTASNPSHGQSASVVPVPVPRGRIDRDGFLQTLPGPSCEHLAAPQLSGLSSSSSACRNMVGVTGNAREPMRQAAVGKQPRSLNALFFFVSYAVPRLAFDTS